MAIDQQILDAACYGRNYLAEVVVRVDFLTSLNSLRESFPKALSDVVSTWFPIAEPKNQIVQEVRLVSGVPSPGTREEFTEWNFWGRDREKRLAVSHNSLFIQYKRYARYEDIRAEFVAVLDAVLRLFPDVQPRRLGIRYVNKIEVEGSPLDWVDWLQPFLVAALGAPYSESLSRTIQVAEFNFGDFKLRYQYGIPNADHPAVIRQKTFVLDLDAFTDSAFDSRNIATNLDQFHSRIQDLFESSITDRLRGVMGVVQQG